MAGQKFHPKRGAFTGSGREADLALEPFGRLMDDGQPHPGALILRVGRASLEGLEEAFLHLRRNADPLVPDTEPNHFMAPLWLLTPNADLRPRIRVSEFQRVAQK